MRFEAPWSAAVKIVTVGASAILLFASFLAARHVPADSSSWIWWLAVVGPLAGVREVRHDPAAMECSWRLFGNGGLFVIAGLFSNRELGRYRAFATNPKNSVVLDLGDRKIVVTPGRPEELVRRLEELLPLVQHSA